MYVYVHLFVCFLSWCWSSLLLNLLLEAMPDIGNVSPLLQYWAMAHLSNLWTARGTHCKGFAVFLGPVTCSMGSTGSLAAVTEMGAGGKSQRREAGPETLPAAKGAALRVVARWEPVSCGGELDSSDLRHPYLCMIEVQVTQSVPLSVLSIRICFISGVWKDKGIWCNWVIFY